MPIITRKAGQAEFPPNFLLELPVALDQAAEEAAEREEPVVLTAALDKEATGCRGWRMAKLLDVDGR